MLINQIEDLIEGFYKTLRVDAQTCHDIGGMLHRVFDELVASESSEPANLATRRDQPEAEQMELLQATTPARCRSTC